MPKKKTTETIKSKPKKTSSNKEKSDYTKLTDFIQETYLNNNFEKEDIPWAYLSSQIGQITKAYSISYSDFLNILKYMVQIENIDFTDRNTLGLVPYYIDKTNNYMLKYKQVKANVKKFQNSEKIVKISNHNQNGMQRRIKKNETFND